MHEKRHFLSYRMGRRDAQKHVYMCVLRHSGECGRDKMASSTEEDEEEKTRETCIQPYQFEPIGQNSAESRPEHPASSRDARIDNTN